jgi:hypothetical protein
MIQDPEELKFSGERVAEGLQAVIENGSDIPKIKFQDDRLDYIMATLREDELTRKTIVEKVKPQAIVPSYL